MISRYLTRSVLKGQKTGRKRHRKGKKPITEWGSRAGICRVSGQYFVRAWTVIVNKRGQIGSSSSLSAPLPQKFMRLIEDGVELGKANDIISGRKNTKHKEGYFGFISDSLVTREKGYVDSVIMALACFKKPGLFE